MAVDQEQTIGHLKEHAVKEQTREQRLFKAREYVGISEGVED